MARWCARAGMHFRGDRYGLRLDTAKSDGSH
jgi:hypothetical protein